MPFKVEGLQESFKLELADGLPVAPVTKLGAMHYVLCCPLCGLLHEVGQVSQGVIPCITHEPRCMVKPPHPITVAKWLAVHPEAADYRQIVLKLREFDAVVISTPARIAA